MGRNPLLTTIRKYLERMDGMYSAATLYDKRTTLLSLARDFNALRRKDPGRGLRAEPRNWGEREILAVLEIIRRRGTSLSTQVVVLGVVERMLDNIGNPIVERMRRENPQVFPRRPQSLRKGSLRPDQLDRILEACSAIPGWRGECAKFLVAGFVYLGARLTELRLARIMDLDMRSPDANNWILRIAFPKGERVHGVRDLPIPEPLRPVLTRFIRARGERLAELGLPEKPERPLVFSIADPERPWSKSTIEHLVRDLRAKTGVQFTPHTLRRTYGQWLLDNGVSLQAVSQMLGHSSTDMTEKYYARQSEDRARAAVLEAFAAGNAPQTPRYLGRDAGTENRLILGKYDTTGYA